MLNVFTQYTFFFTAALIILFLNSFVHPANSQETDTIPVVEEDAIPAFRDTDTEIDEDAFYQRIESIVEELDEDAEIDFAELIEELEYYAQNPLNLNYAREEDLQRFFFLNTFQIHNLLSYISVHGRLISIYELQAIEGWDMETIELILPFVMVEEERPRRYFTFDDMMSEGESQMFVRYQQVLEEQRGFSAIDPEELEENPNARYQGSPFMLYSRYRFTYYNNLSLGFTAQKRPGEQFFHGDQPYGFEFYSGHFFMRDFGRIKSLSVGDFQAQFGQGLALWSNLAFGKSYDAINTKKNPLGLRQYTSTDRNQFLRGVGSTIRLGDFEVTGFISHKKRDGNVLEYDTLREEALSITSLTATGNARLPREVENRRTVDETIYGGNVTYKQPTFSIGTTAYRYELGAKLDRNLSFHNQFDFSSQSNTNVSLDYNYIFRNFNVFGEFAMSKNGGYAMLNGIMASIDPRFSVSVLHRHITKDYQALMGNAFTENTRVVNERGLYLGVTANLSREWTLYAYADHFQFPWMKHRTYAPSRGYDYLGQVSYSPSREIDVYLRYRNRNKPLNSPYDVRIRYLDDVVRQNIRFHISYDVSDAFEFRNRVEFVDFAHGEKKEQGYMLYHDIIYRTLDKPLDITLRYALYDTDGYDSRIYAYENNVLYAFGFPFYSYKGSRSYLLFRYKLTYNIDIWARYAYTFYTNRASIGTGLNEINDNTRSEITAQIRLKF